MRTVASSFAESRRYRDTLIILGFGLFSYVLLSTWGALVAESLKVILSQERLVSCAAGAGIFWFAIRRLKQRREVSLSSLLGVIVGAGLIILAVRLGLNYISPNPVTVERSVRWSLAWSGYFGIWLLAVVPPCAPGGAQSTDSTGISALPDAYLDHLFKVPDA